MSKVIIVISNVRQDHHNVDTIKQPDGETTRNFHSVDDANDWCFEYLSNCKKKNNNRGLVSNPEVHKTWKFGSMQDTTPHCIILTILTI